jgi:pSer/pThr/pTyr-binding forkhead associated (FHA) protein
MNEEMDLTEAEDEAVEAVEEQVEAEEEEEAETRPRLVLKRDGAETDLVFPFGCPATIGRFDPSVGPIDVDLGNEPEGSYVSRKHAKITEEEGVYTLVDLGSSNGTYVLREDFEKIDSEPIEDGAEIALGNARFVFHVG